ncbi:MAG: sulfotransferase domain-containing protein [Phycisphaeraceae bacterium]|nr:sulfotransferase domain-containing protein [Phycisphaeraceae bacterium]
MANDLLPEATGDPVIVASHRRSGTHLTIDLLRRQFRAFHQRLAPFAPIDLLYLSIDRFHTDHFNPITQREARRRFLRAKRICLKTHLMPGLPGCKPELQKLADQIHARATRIYVVRDVRDVLISDALLDAKSRGSSNIDFNAFVHQTEDNMPRPAYWATHVQSWSAQPGTFILRYQDLIREPAQSIERIASHIHERPLNRQPLLPSPLRSRREYILRRAIGDPSATTIRGRPAGLPKPPRWHEVLSPESIALIDKHAGSVMADLFPEQYSRVNG